MHPTRVTELIVRGIFLLRKREVDFLYKVSACKALEGHRRAAGSLTREAMEQHGTNFLYPERWEAFRDAIPEAERGDLLAAYHRRLTSDDPSVRLAAAKAWATWERTTSNLIPPVTSRCRLVCSMDVWLADYPLSALRCVCVCSPTRKTRCAASSGRRRRSRASSATTSSTAASCPARASCLTPRSRSGTSRLSSSKDGS